MNLESLDARLAGTRFTGHGQLLASVTSTNDALQALASAGAPEGTFLIAGEQTAGRALLDNMDLPTMRLAVQQADGRIELEASGGLRPGNLRAVAETGVDCLSLGWLTHSSPAADLAMETEPQR